MYKYDASVYCDWLTAMINVCVLGKSPIFSCHTVGFFAEIYESCIMIMNSPSICTHEYRWHVHKSLQHVHAWIYEHMNHDRIWTNKFWVPSFRGSYLDPSLWKQLRLWDPSTLEVIGQNEIPPNVETYGSPCRLVLCNNGHKLSSLLDQATQEQ